MSTWIVEEQICGSPSVALGSVATITPGKFLEMQILRPYPKTIESETLGVGPKKSSQAFQGMHAKA